GKVVVFKVVERKRIQIIDYRGSKALTTTNIEDELKKEEEGLKIDTFYDPAKARKVEARIKQIDFVGNTTFSDETLAKQMKKIKAKGFFNLSWLGGKTTYTEEKWNGGKEDPGDGS